MAQPTDIITLERAKMALRIPDGDARRHELLEVAITAASRAIDGLVGPVVQRDVVDERHHGVSGGSFSLRYSPVFEVSALAEWRTGAPTPLALETTTTAGDYWLEPYQLSNDPPGLLSGRVFRRASWGAHWWRNADIVVSYTAGRYADTETAQNTQFGQAANVYVSWLWEQEWFGVGRSGELTLELSRVPQTVPRAVRQMLCNDIDDLLVG